MTPQDTQDADRAYADNPDRARNVRKRARRGEKNSENQLVKGAASCRSVAVPAVEYVTSPKALVTPWPAGLRDRR